MRAILSLLAISFFSVNLAHADVEATKGSNSSGIASAEVFSLKVSGRKPTLKQVADEVAKRIRHGYHRRGATIDSATLSRVVLSKVSKDLSQADGDFQGLRKADLEKMYSWIEDKQVASTAYKMVAEGSYMGANGTAVHYILLPSDYSDPVLVITYDQSREE
jgi:hypothetical protein